MGGIPSPTGLSASTCGRRRPNHNSKPLAARACANPRNEIMIFMKLRRLAVLTAIALAALGLVAPAAAHAACTPVAEACNGLDDDCDGIVDENSVCRSDSMACSCTPYTCQGLGKNCGPMPDGCGAWLNCGACGEAIACSDNVCECKVVTCESRGAICGTISDGCGRFPSCGDCSSGMNCVNNRCVQPPPPCPTGSFRCCDGSCNTNKGCPGISCDPGGSES